MHRSHKKEAFLRFAALALVADSAIASAGQGIAERADSQFVTTFGDNTVCTTIFGAEEPTLFRQGRCSTGFPFESAIARLAVVGYEVCSGVAIADQWILTAAHCVDQGEVSIRFTDGDRRVVERCPSSIGDIALVRFEGARAPLVFNPDQIVENRDPQAGLMVKVVGWAVYRRTQGTLVCETPAISKPMPVIDRESCVKHYESFPGAKRPTEVDFCAGSSESSACPGDSGGPLFVLDPAGLQAQLIGIVSRGVPASSCSDKFDIYTSIPKDWVLGIVASGKCPAKD